MTSLTVSGYIFFLQIFKAVKNAISHLKEHRIYFLEEKKVVFMEANNIFKKNYKSLKIDKNKTQNLAKQKKITLLYEFEVRI